jgi:hypothetical protein
MSSGTVGRPATKTMYSQNKPIPAQQAHANYVANTKITQPVRSPASPRAPVIPARTLTSMKPAPVQALPTNGPIPKPTPIPPQQQQYASPANPTLPDNVSVGFGPVAPVQGPQDPATGMVTQQPIMQQPTNSSQLPPGVGIGFGPAPVDTTGAGMLQAGPGPVDIGTINGQQFGGGKGGIGIGTSVGGTNYDPTTGMAMPL